MSADAIRSGAQGIAVGQSRAVGAAEAIASSTLAVAPTRFADALAGVENRDLVSSLVELQSAKNQVFANAATIRAADAMLADVFAAIDA
ncbi:MAG: hypothetical protein AAGA56_14515 [Myxococcota bacterium]